MGVGWGVIGDRLKHRGPEIILLSSHSSSGGKERRRMSFGP